MFAVQTVIGDSAMTGLGNLTTYITRASVIKTESSVHGLMGYVTQPVALQNKIL